MTQQLTRLTHIWHVLIWSMNRLTCFVHTTHHLLHFHGHGTWLTSLHVISFAIHVPVVWARWSASFVSSGNSITTDEIPLFVIISCRETWCYSKSKSQAPQIVFELIINWLLYNTSYVSCLIYVKYILYKLYILKICWILFFSNFKSYLKISIFL